MKKRYEPVEGRNAEIIEDVMSCPEVLPLGEDKKFKIRLCVEEVEENILGYSGTTWVEVHALVEDGMLSISFRDEGVEFNPLDRPDPDINAPLEERSIGGLGIYLCKKLMDSVTYQQENGCNVLTLKLNV